MPYSTPSSAPRTLESVENGEIKLSDLEKKRLYLCIKLLDEFRIKDYDTNKEVGESFYWRFNAMNREAKLVAINHLLDIIDQKEMYKTLYRHILEAQILLTGRSLPSSFISYPFEMQTRYCIRYKRLNTLRFIMTDLKGIETPNILRVAMETGDEELFYDYLALIGESPKTEILQYIPNMDMSEDTMLTIAKELISRNIGTRWLHRALYAALENKKYKLFSYFLLQPKTDVCKWDCFGFREAIYLGEYAVARAYLAHPSMDRPRAKQLLHDFEKERLPMTDSQKTMGKKLLREYIDRKLEVFDLDMI